MNHIDILTCQPEILDSPFNNSIIKIAQEKNLVSIKVHNLRDYTEDKHRKVDHSPFGGGGGMILKIEPVYNCIGELKKKKGGYSWKYPLKNISYLPQINKESQSIHYTIKDILEIYNCLYSQIKPYLY